MAMQIRISGAQNNATRLVWIVPVQENDQTQATLQRLGPHDRGIQGQMRCLCSCAESRETASVWAVDRPRICAPCPTALWVRPGVEKQAGGGAPQSGDRVPSEVDDFLNLCLLCLVAIHPMIGDSRRQAQPMRTPWLRVAVDPGCFRLRSGGFLSRRRLRDCARQSAPVCDINHRERGKLQPPLGTARTAVAAVAETERLLATCCDAGRVMRRDQCRVRVACRQQHALMEVGPVKRLPELPRDGTCSIVTGAPEVTAG